MSKRSDSQHHVFNYSGMLDPSTHETLLNHRNSVNAFARPMKKLVEANQSKISLKQNNYLKIYKP